MKIFSIGLLALILMVTIFVGVFAKNKKEEAPMFKYTNMLADEKSSYLLQHAHNPVNWRPWGDEAFAKASAEDKPIFLSIGCSTCHWRHVMEHESFEDEQVAKLMNDSFISIKVDREERPDIDNVYMSVCQMMTGSGGWPLTIIMTPDKKPFFAGTFIPKESHYGRMGMMELLPRVSDLWKTDRQRLLQSADEIVGHLSKSTAEQAGNDLDAALLDRTFNDLSGRYDDQLGGFDDAPKFPTPHNLLFLMRHYQHTGDAKALQMVVKTLTMMHRGGVYDQIGFGFHRYSTDRQWLLPHFEKMIYDQAMLVLAYSEAWQLTGDEEFAQTAREIIAYVLRDMTALEGGFYSAEDADSDGEEGAFYVWTKQELDDLLGADAEWFEALFNVTPGGIISWRGIAGPAYEIVVVGDAQAQDVRAMMRALNDRYLPNSVVVLRDSRQPQHIDALSAFVQGYEAIDGKATAYVCRSFACQLPTASVEKMLQLLPAISAAHK